MTRALFVALLVACSSSPPVISSDISTRDTRLMASAVADESSSSLRVDLQGPGGAMILVDGDRLVASLGSQEVSLIPLGKGSFALDLGAATGEIDVSFLRPHDQPLTTSLVLPPAFTVHAPTSAARTTPLTITWDAATGPWSVLLAVTGPCIVGASRTLSLDTGTYTFNAGELFAATATGNCTATVEMARMTASTKQSRKITFESTP